MGVMEDHVGLCRLIAAIRRYYLKPLEMEQVMMLPYHRRRKELKKMCNQTGTTETFKLPQVMEALRNKIRASSIDSKTTVQFSAKCILEGESANGLRGVFVFAKTPHNMENERVVVFAPPSMWDECLTAGATVAGSTDLVNQVMEGQLEMDKCIASLDQIGVVAKLARILGPKGLMPTVKTNTLVPISMLISTIETVRKSTPFRVDRSDALMTVNIGRLDWADSDLLANLKQIMSYANAQSHRLFESASLALVPSNTVSTADQVIGKVDISPSEFSSQTGSKYLVSLQQLRARVAARDAQLHSS